MRTYTEQAERIRKENRGNAADHYKAAEAEQAKARALRGERAAAIEKGDQSRYMEICREIEYHEGRASYEANIAAEAGAAPSLYAEVWRDYVADFNKEYKKRLAAYNKIKLEFAKAYIELLTFYAEANRQTAAARKDLEGAREGKAIIWETLPKIEPLPVAKRLNHCQSAESTIAAEALQLDTFKAENIADIENGAFIGVYDKSNSELIAEALRKKETAPIFPYPMRIPETDEERIKRQSNGDNDPPIGYLMPDGSYKKTEYKAQEAPGLW